MQMKNVALVTVLFAAASHSAAVEAQPLRLGEEFQVNTYTIRAQIAVSAAADDAGDFVIVWESYPGQDGYGAGVFGQRYASSGAPLGTEFQVNSYTTGYQNVPTVCRGDAGFVVAWSSDYQDYNQYGIFAQRYSSDGARLGSEFQVNSYTFDSQFQPQLACRNDGSFVVAWDSYQDDYGYGIFAQRYASNGAPAGTEFQVNEFTNEDSRNAHLCLDASGTMVAAWFEEPNGPVRIVGRRFDSAGIPLGGDFVVASGAIPQYRMQFGLDCHDSGFVVAWPQSFGSDYDVFARRYDTSGAPIGSAFQVNTYTPDFQGVADRSPGVLVASAAGGDFTVVWSDWRQDGDDNGVFGQRFDSAGSPSGTEFQVNSFTAGDQSGNYNGLAAAAAANGDFVVAWGSGPHQDGDRDGIFAQHFAANVEPICAGAPLAGCHQPTQSGKGRLLMKKAADSSGDKIIWEWKRGEETTLAELGDPVNGTTSYALCIYDETAGSPTLFLGAAAPAAGACSGPCWRSVGMRGLNYADPTGTPNGIRRMVLRANREGRARMLLKAKGANLALPSLTMAQDPRIRVQLVNSDGACWEGSYSQPAVRHDQKVFHDKVD